MADETREIRARVDLVDLVSQRVSLKKAGKTWKGLCPFHEDRNPSFTVSSETGRYKCWSCGEAGDIFTWVMKTQNVEFKDALQILAKAAGVTLSRSGPKQDSSQREVWQTAMAEALSFFKEQLAKSSHAIEYCERRGLSKEVLETWELGYAPDVGDALAGTLKRKGLPLAECKQLFLVDTDSSGGFFDKFRARLIFPIRDERGELVAFGGRLLGDGVPKYINSSDTPIYRKSRVLYGMNRAKEALQKERRAVLVEGYLDVIACHQAGVTGALASLGTSLAEDHARLLKRWCDEVVILYDSDAAGQKAAHRAVDILKVEGLKVRIALMPDGEDPDTLLKSGGTGAVLRTIEKSVAPMEFDLHELQKRLKPSQTEFWDEAVGILATAPNEMELDRFIVQLAPLYPGLRDPVEAIKTIRREVDRQRKRPAPRVPYVAKAIVEPAVVVTDVQSLKVAELIVLRAFLSEDLREAAWEALQDADLMMTGLGADIASAINGAFPLKAPEGPPSLWLSEVQPEAMVGALNDLQYDRRVAQLSETVLSDTIEGLKTRKVKREFTQKKSTSADRNDLLMQLRKLNPDTRETNNP